MTVKWFVITDTKSVSTNGVSGNMPSTEQKIMTLAVEVTDPSKEVPNGQGDNVVL